MLNIFNTSINCVTLPSLVHIYLLLIDRSHAHVATSKYVLGPLIQCLLKLCGQLTLKWIQISCYKYKNKITNYDY